MFQDFYLQAASHVSTHISLEASQRHDRGSRSPSTSSRSSSISKGANRANATNIKDRDLASTNVSSSAQQMLTTAEIEDRRRARQRLERKRIRLEEAIERRVCEAVYERIWRHRSTQDEERDEKLRSRTAALEVIGIAPGELGIELGQAKEEDVRVWLDPARDELLQMNDEKCPLGKLLHLKAAHKGIVDTLSRLHPSSSSADEILPTLIYTLMTTRPEGINVISNLYFIQRFRAASKIDGEAAYALTNLEAAISFLENVDIASLRADEPSSGPRPVGKPATSMTSAAPRDTSAVGPESPITSSMSNPTIMTSHVSAAAQTPLAASPSSHHRRISDLLQPPSNALSVAGDAVLTQADQSLKTISNTLEFSYGLLFGRLKERHLGDVAVDDDSVPVLPKTLDEARKLVSTPPPADLEGPSSQAGAQMDGATGPINDKVLSLLGGSKMLREKSSDSTRSGGSGKRVSFMEEAGISKTSVGTAPSSVPIMATAPAAVPVSGRSLSPAMESMKNLGNTLNPLNRFAGVNAMLSFGRASSSSPPAAPRRPSSPSKANAPGVPSTLGRPGAPAPPGLVPNSPTAASSSPQSAATAAVSSSCNTKRSSEPAPTSGSAIDQIPESQEPESISATSCSAPINVPIKIAPPIAKFMELENPGDLKINEVLELLRDYRRLAGALRDLNHF